MEINSYGEKQRMEKRNKKKKLLRVAHIISKRGEKKKKDEKRNRKNENGEKNPRIKSKQITDGRINAKTKKSQEGMFLKGVRSHYVQRGFLNAANEARRNEDINKIIDLGSITQRQEKETKKRSEFSESPPLKKKKRPISKILRPIQDTTIGNSSANFDDKLKTFKTQYEKTVGSVIISKLPKIGLLETALESLRKHIERDSPNEKADHGEINVNSLKYLSEKNIVPSQKMYKNNGFYQQELLSSEESFLNFHVFSPATYIIPAHFQNIKIDFDNQYFSNSSPFDTDIKSMNVRLPCTDIENKNLETKSQTSRFTTPTVHFYRRNMF